MIKYDADVNLTLQLRGVEAGSDQSHEIHIEVMRLLGSRLKGLGQFVVNSTNIHNIVNDEKTQDQMDAKEADTPAADLTGTQEKGLLSEDSHDQVAGTVKEQEKYLKS